MDLLRSPLHGRVVELIPLELSHAEELFAITPPDCFEHFLTWPAAWRLDEFRAFLARLLDADRQVSFAVRRNDTGVLCGSTSFLDIDLKNRSVEIGATWYAADARATAINPECKRLMLARAFDEQHVVRVTLKCDARNMRSQAAIAKLGATREGVLRNHRIRQDGSPRDTVMFGITDAQWPAVRQRLDDRLAALLLPPAQREQRP